MVAWILLAVGLLALALRWLLIRIAPPDSLAIARAACLMGGVAAFGVFGGAAIALPEGWVRTLTFLFGALLTFGAVLETFKARPQP